MRFGFDLPAREDPVARPPTENPEPSREILEIKATTPEGNSTVRTVILPPYEALSASLLARSAGQGTGHGRLEPGQLYPPDQRPR